MHRVEKLADREDGRRPEGSPAFTALIPLQEIIAESLNVGTASKKVDALYRALIERLGSEFTILRDVPLDEIERAGSPLIREAVSRMRGGKVRIAPGYDGEYGKIRIFEESERDQIGGQLPFAELS
jgi:PHP family Zn ribbon phosphoesterase